MENKTSHADDLKAIRKMMENSSRFFSLSGLSGVFAGFFAIIGGGYAWYFILRGSASIRISSIQKISEETGRNCGLELLLVAAIVLVLAVSVAYYLSYRKSSRAGSRLWNPISKRMFINFLIPLVSGAIFIAAMIIQGLFMFVPPAMLLFYGIALVNAGKYTFGEIHYLGLLQVITGLASSFFPDHGLLFWVAGFGFLHILYGLIMYRKYE